MSYKPIECPRCHAMLRSKYEVRDGGEIRKWKWLSYCPVCGTRLKVVFGKPWNCVEGAEVVDDAGD